MRGNVTPETLARVMRALAINNKEGVLHLSRDGVSKRIYFRDGLIIFAGSDDEQKRFGEMGFTTPADLAEHTLERTKSIVRSVFAWPNAQFHFEERDASIGEEMALALSPTGMILDGVQSIEDPVLIRESLGDVEAVPRRPMSPLVPYEERSLSSPLQWILYQANGVSTIREIVDSAPLEPDDTLRSILALLAAGILEVERTEQVADARGEHTTVNPPSWKSSSSPPVLEANASGSFPHTIGRYEVKKILGRGAMGAVYLAEDPTIDRPVAIKLIQTAVQLNAAELERYRERFYREAKAAGKLLHSGIVTVFDVGHTHDETPFIVMEYVEGKTLGRLLAAGPVVPDAALQLCVKILDALAYAHQKGIVHRDIKLANILVTADGQPKIMDFGIAHFVGSDLTQAGDVLGSPNYMAPEQLSKGAIDQRTDLFAFGVVVYRMLTGKLPFTGDSFAAIANAILSEEPPAPHSVNPAVPAALSPTVLRCLSKDPAARFANAKALKRELLASSTDKVPSGPERARSEPRPDKRDLGEPAAVAGKDAILRRPKLALAAGAVLAAFLAAAISSFSRNPGPQGSASTLPLPNDVKAQMFDDARLAFDKGDFEQSKFQLEALLERSPSFAAAAELLLKVDDEIWKRSLPMSFRANHNHRIGGCSGTLTLDASGMGYGSKEHEWRWVFEEIRSMEMNDRSVLNLETRETEDISARVARVIGMGTPKKYKFELRNPVPEEDWARYLRLAR